MPTRPGTEAHRLRPALERTLRALREQERLTEADAWLVAMCRTVADRADSKAPDRRQYLRLAVQLEARLLGQAPPPDDEFARLVLEATGAGGPG